MLCALTAPSLAWSGSIEVNSPLDVDLASLPYNASVRSDGQCTLVEALELAKWKNFGGQAATKPTQDCGNTVSTGANDIKFTESYHIHVQPRQFGQAAFEINSEIHLIGPSAIDAKPDEKTEAPNKRMFRVGAGVKFKLSNQITIQNARLLDAGNGAAILVDNPNATLEVYDCEFNSNHASPTNGGGGAIASTSFDVKIEKSRFFHNSAAEGGAYRGPAMSVKESHFLDNDASKSGGALHITTGGPLNVQNIETSVFRENTVYHKHDPAIYPLSSRGGAIFSQSKLILSTSVFRGNRVYSDQVSASHPILGSYKKDSEIVKGGAIFLGIDAERGSTISRAAFLANEAGFTHGQGAGIYLERSASIEQSAFYKNIAAEGTSIYSIATSVAPDDKTVLANSSAGSNDVMRPYNGLDENDVFTNGAAIAVVSNLPFHIANSFLFHNNGTNLFVKEGGTATLANTAIGVVRGTFPINCVGNVVDLGSNIQSRDQVLDNYNKPSCPATIPLVPNKAGFASFITSTTQYKGA